MGSDSPHPVDRRALARDSNIDRRRQLAQPASSLSAYHAAPFQDVRTEWDIARFSITVTPTLDLDLNADYTLTRKTGNRPLSMAFGSPGNIFVEFIQPIDQTIHDFRLRASYAGEGWQLQGAAR